MSHVEDVFNTLDGFDLTCIGMVVGPVVSRAGRGLATTVDWASVAAFLALVWVLQSDVARRRTG